jgi:hypothetical protein
MYLDDLSECAGADILAKAFYSLSPEVLVE